MPCLPRCDRRLLFFALALLAIAGPVAPAWGARSSDEVWADAGEGEIPVSGERWIVPDRYRLVRLDAVALEVVLSAAPREGSGAPGQVLTLPLPDGGFGRFLVEESPIMAPELAAKFPELRTFRGQGLDDPTATVRFDTTPSGLHAMILAAGGSVWIDPFQRGDAIHHISYAKRDARRSPDAPFACGVTGKPERASRSLDGAEIASGAVLRSYRLAVAATGEYTDFHGGTVGTGMAAIVTAMNRVNGIYEREVAIRMILVADNDLLVYTDGATDPYTNNSGFAMLGENQTNVDAVIGSANYDIGHVFSTGGGGVASLGVPCTIFKARGVTGLSQPTGDVFWVDYVAHEMGHQWGANHSFNGNGGSCGGGNRNGSTAYEPGSGSTIMGYAGICGSHDLQSNSDDYFHAISFDEIVEYTNVGGGTSCPVLAATGNEPPGVEAGEAHTIPIETPFALCGAAIDPDGDNLTFGWEEFDLGPAGHPDSPSGNAPIFRSFDPASTPERIFPTLDDLLANTHTIGELLPAYARDMSFRLTARDNRSGGGGVDFDTTTVTVSDVGGPFRVTSPNTAVSWTGGTTQTVTWDVAGTDLVPISCATVHIELSIDGGMTFPLALGSGANDGSQTVTVPAIPTVAARIRVRCATSVFFDLSDADFTVTGAQDPLFLSTFEDCDPFAAWSAVVP